MNATKLCNSPSATQALAARLAAQCETGDVLLLQGDVGAGKTTFARGFIQAAARTSEDITSPTFNLLQTYPLASGATLFHYDLYRVKHRAELQELGLEEAFANGITLIEWPDIARDELPAGALTIAIHSDGDARRFDFSSSAPHWQTRLRQL